MWRGLVLSLACITSFSGCLASQDPSHYMVKVYLPDGTDMVFEATSYPNNTYTGAGMVEVNGIKYIGCPFEIEEFEP